MPPVWSFQVRLNLNSALTGQLGCKQQPMKATAVRLARVQDPTSTLGLSMPGLSALLAGKVNDMCRLKIYKNNKETYCKLFFYITFFYIFFV